MTVTDANGCYEKASADLAEPERSDWTMTGNANTNPATQYIGTSDNKDVVFRTQDQERLRITAGGELRAASLTSPTGYGLLMVDSLGTMKRLTGATYPTYIGDRPGCPAGDNWPWTMCGNHVSSGNVFGSTNAKALKIITANTVRMTIDPWGKVGIGTTPPMWEVEDYRLFVENGIVCRDVLVKVGAWPDYVFESDYKLMPLSELRTFLGFNKHLPGIPSASEVDAKEGVELGDLQKRLIRVVEEQALYILQLEKGQRELELRLLRLESMELHENMPKR